MPSEFQEYLFSLDTTSGAVVSTAINRSLAIRCPQCGTLADPWITRTIFHPDRTVTVSSTGYRIDRDPPPAEHISRRVARYVCVCGAAFAQITEADGSRYLTECAAPRLDRSDSP